MAHRVTHMQNEYGVSYPGMIIMAIMNSDTKIPNAFCNRVVTIRDIYTFITAHVVPIRDMDAKGRERLERVLRHSLSQTNYFHRFQVGEDGIGRIIPSQTGGAEKGGLWTLHPPQGQTEARTWERIRKVLHHRHLIRFGPNLANSTILHELVNGDYGWRRHDGTHMKPSHALSKYNDQVKKYGVPTRTIVVPQAAVGPATRRTMSVPDTVSGGAEALYSMRPSTTDVTQMSTLHSNFERLTTNGYRIMNAPPQYSSPHPISTHSQYSTGGYPIPQMYYNSPYHQQQQMYLPPRGMYPSQSAPQGPVPYPSQASQVSNVVQHYQLSSYNSLTPTPIPMMPSQEDFDEMTGD